ncbi:MAG: IS4 family transposase, partial [Roseofilum sp. SID2]|nr:IS4 family transposase [Roseofilum sp. SID2]
MLDSNLTSMRSLFYRFNHTGIEIDISTFSKACKSREDTCFYRVYYQLIQKIKKKRPVEAMNLMAIDSTVITLTSKLFWSQKYHQVKLINGREISSENLTECLINFGQEHEAKFKDQVMTMIPDGAVAIMDRGFAS